MDNDDYKGFRQGVKTAACGRATSLGEFVAVALAAEQAPAPADMGPLDLIELGAVYVDDERSMNPARPLKPGEIVRIHSDPRRFECPADLSSRIITETEDSLLIEKPAGLPAGPTVDNVKENLISFLQDLRGQNLLLTHRLAAESEGLLLIAKSPETQARITRAFAEGKVRRQFAAYTERPLQEGEHSLFTVFSCEERRAETNLITEGRLAWQIEGEPLKVFYRLQIEFTMARPKEIRLALATSGRPVLGDRAHGSNVQLTDAVSQKPALAFYALSLSV